MTKYYVYVDVPRILRNCHCMYDVYTAGVLAKNLRVILIGILHNCEFDSLVKIRKAGMQWSAKTLLK